MVPKSNMTGVRKKGEIWTHVKASSFEDEGRYQGDAFTSQGTPTISSQLSEAREKSGSDFPS